MTGDNGFSESPKNADDNQQRSITRVAQRVGFDDVAASDQVDSNDGADLCGSSSPARPLATVVSSSPRRAATTPTVSSASLCRVGERIVPSGRSE